MEIIDIKDYFKISDDHSEVRGFIEVKDSDGNTIFVKENMITETGREYIKKLVYAGFGYTSDESRTLHSIHFNKDGGITNSSDTELHGTSTTDDIVFLLNQEGPSNGYTYSITVTDNARSLRFSIDITDIPAENSIVFREAGLFLDNGDMFSRVAFAPLTLKTGNTYKINYYIYF